MRTAQMLWSLRYSCTGRNRLEATAQTCPRTVSKQHNPCVGVCDTYLVAFGRHRKSDASCLTTRQRLLRATARPADPLHQCERGREGEREGGVFTGRETGTAVPPKDGPRACLVNVVVLPLPVTGTTYARSRQTNAKLGACRIRCLFQKRNPPTSPCSARTWLTASSRDIHYRMALSDDATGASSAAAGPPKMTESL